MEKENIKISYDKEEDLLSLFSLGSRVKFSFDISVPDGDIVVDYDFDGKIVGLEFFNASRYFPMLNKVKDSKELKAILNVKYGPNWAQINYSVYLKDVKNPPIMFLNAPYNKKMILKV